MGQYNPRKVNLNLYLHPLVTYTQAGLTKEYDGNSKHKDLNTGQIAKSEATINECLSAFEGFFNPFTIEDKGSLYNIASGVKVPVEVEKDILLAEDLGEKRKDEFIEERLKTNSKFFDPIKKLNLKTMGTCAKSTKVKTSTNKVIELKNQGNIAFKLLVLSQKRGVSLEEIMSYQLTPIPYCLGTPDGFLNTTNKALGLKTLDTRFG